MSQESEKKSFLDYFSIENETSCLKSIKNGGIAAMISAAITSVFAVIGVFSNSSDPVLQYLLDPWFSVDAFLILILGIFIFKKSRVASTMMFIYFIVSKIMIWKEVGTPNNFFISLLFLYFYFMAMRGTYLWHSKYSVNIASEND